MCYKRWIHIQRQVSSLWANYRILSLSGRFSSILQSCNVDQGKQVHAQFIVNGIRLNPLLGSKILGVYVVGDRFDYAQKLFYEIGICCTMAWNWMIRGFVKLGSFEFALLFYFKMLGCGILPDKYTFPPVIKACGGLNDVRLGRLVYDTISSMGFEIDVFLGSSLVKLFAENGCIDEARYLFDRMSERDCVMWNVMIRGLVKYGLIDDAIKVFGDMRCSDAKPEAVSFTSILSVCASEGMIEFGTQLHGLAVCYGLELDPNVANTLVAMYSKVGFVDDAHKMFKLKPVNDSVTWNGMIGGYVQNGDYYEALTLFREMISDGARPNSITLSSFLPSVSGSACLKLGKEVHCYILRHSVTLDLCLRSTLIDMYFRCRDVESALVVFNATTSIDIVMYTAMISGYVLNRLNHDAVKIFRLLLEEKLTPNAVTLATIVPACAGLAALRLGKELHCHILKRGLEDVRQVGSSIIDMYAKCGRLDLAREIFRWVPEKDVVTWNSLISSSCQNGKPEEAIYLLRQMGMEQVKYDAVTISAALSACANLPALHHGKTIHSVVLKGALHSDIFAESGLIDMYAKCGNLNAARRVFDMMQEKNEVSWNSIIAAYGSHGFLKDSLALFHNMLEQGIQPDHVTFLGIISACAHAGKVDDGVHYFCCMTEVYGIPALMEHYSSMVDLYGRAGRLHEAYETIKSMPFSPDAGIWGTLLGACRVHGNVELAELASRHLCDLDPDNSGYYVLLANTLANAGQWGSADKIRDSMKQRRIQKIPGYSWIAVNNTSHMFVSTDRSHPRSAEIYSLLKSLLLVLRKDGYVTESYYPLQL